MSETEIKPYEELGGSFCLQNSASASAVGSTYTNVVKTQFYGQISDFVWHDQNNDGLQSPGEPGIAGVTVRLLDADGNPMRDVKGNLIEAVTDANGLYKLVGVPRGEGYTVAFELPAGYYFTTPDVDGLGIEGTTNSTAGADGQSAPFDMGPGQSRTTLDAGLIKAGSIGDFVWFDANMNGLQDEGEEGVAGVTVRLLDGNGAPVLDRDGQLVESETDANGYYQFSDLRPGTYMVEFGQVPGKVFTVYNADGAGVNGAVNSDANINTGRTAAFVLLDGEEKSTVDAGLVNASAIGDFVWLDLNNDGLQDAGEPGYNGVTVNLLDASGAPVMINGQPVTTVTANHPVSGEPGYYLFEGLKAGNYQVEFVLPGGAASFTLQNADNEGVAGEHNSDVGATTGRTPVFALAMGETRSDIDAGVSTLMELVKTADKVGSLLPGDTVTYTVVVTNSGSVAQESVKVTDALPAGVSYVAGSTKAVLGGVLQLGETVVLVNDASGSFTVPANVNSLTVEAWGAGGGSAYGAGGGGGAYARSVLTVVPGMSYSVSVGAGGATGVNGGNSIFGTGDDRVEAVGGGGATGSNSSPTAGIGGSAATSKGQVVWSGGAGGQRNGTTFTYRGGGGGGSAYTNANGGAGSAGTTSAGGAGGSGTGKGGDGGVANSSGTSGQVPGGGGGGKGSGSTSNGVGAGGRITITYTPFKVADEWTIPAGEALVLTYQVTVDGPPATVADIRNIAYATSTQYTNALSDSTEHPIDESALAKIGDQVWRDQNGDGIQDGGEPGIAGVTVTLYRVTAGEGNTLITNEIATTTTDSDGIYGFERLVPGDYLVKVEQPAGALATPQGAGNNPARDSNGDSEGWSGIVTVVGGQNEETIDFGFVWPNASIGDFVWFDTNMNGLQDAGEPGLAGVIVRLLNGSGNAVLDGDGDPLETVTDADGFYQFSDLVPGTYMVEFGKTAGNVFTVPNADDAGVDGTVNSDADATTGRTPAFVLLDGESKSTVDAGLIKGASVGDFVWLDTNADGLQDAWEQGVNGVTVQLLDGAGNPVLDDNGEPLQTVTANDASGKPGYYQFSGLPAGEYQVKFVPAGGEAFTTQNGDSAGVLGEFNSDVDPATGLTPLFTLAAGAELTSIDAGLVPQLVFAKSSDAGATVAPGQVITYTVAVTNNGTTAQTGVTISDAMPEGTTFVDGSLQAALSVDHQVVDTQVFDASANFTVPAGVTKLQVEAWGGGGSGARMSINGFGGGGGGGAYAMDTITVTPSSSYVVNVAPGSSSEAAGGDSWFSPNTVANALVLAKGGNSAANNVTQGALGGSASDCVGAVCFSGGNGANSGTASSGNSYGGGGGSSAGTASNGNDGNANFGGEAPAGGGKGGNGRRQAIDAGSGSAGAVPGGAGGGAYRNGVTYSGGRGERGQVTVTLMESLVGTTGAAPNLASGWTILPGEVLTVTYQVTVDGPSATVDEIVNRAWVSSVDYPVPLPTETGSFMNKSFLATIGDFVWHDENGDGIQSGGETGLVNVVVELYQVVADDAESLVTNLVTSTTTDANGNYSFDRLLPGDYLVKVATPDGFDSVVAGVGNDAELDSDGDGGGWSGVISVVGGQTDNSIDFGYYQKARLYGYAYQDEDRSLTRSESDTALAGIVIELWYGGTMIGTTNTNAEGYYEFVDLDPGAYEIRFIANPKYVTDLPAPGSEAAGDEQRNRAAAESETQGYVKIDHDLASGEGVAIPGEPLNAGFIGGSGLSSAIDLRAYQAADGVYIEFIAYDVEEEGTITLYLLNSAGQVVWFDEVSVETADEQIARFKVPGLVAGGRYDFAVRDEVGKVWLINDVMVGTLETKFVAMRQDGVELSFTSLPERRYDILWTERLGGTWTKLESVTALREHTTVIVTPPDPESSSGFFKIVLQ